MEKPSVITASFKAIQAALEVLEPLDETQREFALSMILKGLGMSESNAFTDRATLSRKKSGNAGADIKSMTPKDFLREKKPHTDMERLACLAYYLTHAKDTPHFKTEDITTLNTEAAGSKFSNPSATARNAVSQSGFLSHAGSGNKQITPLGEDIVNALPDREAMAQVIANAPKRRKHKSKARSKKKPKAGG